MCPPDEHWDHAAQPPSVEVSACAPADALCPSLHNVVAAAAAYPAGRLGDRWLKLRILIGGYGLGIATNLVLAVFGGSLGWLVAAIVLSGIYISVEETLEKAVAAEFLPAELRSLGFGVLACANAGGDILSTLYVGVLLQRGRPELAFGLASAMCAAGFLWMLFFFRKPIGREGIA